MKKILVPIDGLSCSDSTMHLAADFAKSTKSLLVGVFFHDTSYSNASNLSTWNIVTQHYLGPEPGRIGEDEKMITVIAQFEKICKQKDVGYKIHRYSDAPLVALSAFADLILLDANSSFFMPEKGSRTFLKNLLANSKCPVMILPANTMVFRRAVVAYDGSDSSVYAMKMFSYLFPEWSEMETTLVTVNTLSPNLPNQRELKELAGRHFTNVSFKVLNGNPEKELEHFIGNSAEDTVLVIGSYGRSTYSRMIHESMSDKILKEVKVPVFISHQ